MRKSPKSGSRSLYVPLSVLVYQDEGEPVIVVYDQPSSLMGRFGNRAITGIAQMLDAKLAELVSHVTQDHH